MIRTDPSNLYRPFVKILPYFLVMRLILIVSFLAGSSLLLAQEVPRVEWAPAEKLNMDAFVERILTAGDWGSVLLRGRIVPTLSEPIYWLERYDSSAALQFVLAIDELGFQLLESQVVGDQVYLFGARYPEEGVELVAQIVNRDLTLDGGLRVLHHLQTDKVELVDWVDWTFSPDSSRLLLTHTLPGEGKDPARFQLHLFNKYLEPYWSRELTIDLPPERVLMIDQRLTNEGRALLLMEQFGTITTANTPRVLLLVGATYEAEAPYLFELPGDQRIVDIKMQLLTDERLLIAGLYSVSTNVSARGVYTFKIQPETGEVTDSHIHPFKSSFIEDVQNDNRLSRGVKIPELPRFSSIDLKLGPEGDYYLTAEQQFATLDDRRYNNDIVVVHLEADGTLDWQTYVPKFQQQGDGRDQYAGFQATILEDQFYLLFNSHPKNLEQGDLNRFNFSPNRSALVLTRIDPDGDPEYRSLSTSKEIGTEAEVLSSLVLPNGTVFLGSSRGRTFRLGRVVLD